MSKAEVSVAFQHFELHRAAEDHHLMQREFGYVYLFHMIIERRQLESTSGVSLVQLLLRAGHLSASRPFSTAAERSCPPFSCTLILVSLSHRLLSLLPAQLKL